MLAVYIYVLEDEEEEDCYVCHKTVDKDEIEKPFTWFWAEGGICHAECFVSQEDYIGGLYE